MEQYLIVSDIHGRYSWLTAAIQQAGQVDGILFLGDGWRDVQQLRTEGYSMPIFPVQGNCDLPVAPVTQTLELAGHTLLLCHGHTYHVKDNLARLAQAAKEQGAEGALFGHTHLPTLEQQDGVWLFNPGSLGAPRFGGPSYGILRLEGHDLQLEHRELTL